MLARDVGAEEARRVRKEAVVLIRKLSANFDDVSPDGAALSFEKQVLVVPKYRALARQVHAQSQILEEHVTLERRRDAHDTTSNE